MRFLPDHGDSAGLSYAQQVMPMSVIAVVNRKGGSGKSTLATHVATWLAHRGESVMLGDVDRQHSCTQWLTRRRAHADTARALAGWAVDPQRVLRPPAGTTHVVLDTPGGLHGYELTRLLSLADIVLVPVCDAAFDLESTAECLAELRTHPRVAAGRAQLAVVGMRTEPRGRSLQRLRDWTAEQAVTWLGAIPPAPLYPFCASQGLTVFDLPEARAGAALKHWAPVLARLDHLLKQRDAARPRSPRPIDGASLLGQPVSKAAHETPPGSLPGALPGSLTGALPGALPDALPHTLASTSTWSIGAARAAAQPSRSAPRPAAGAGWWGWLGALWSPASRRQPLHR